MDWFRNVDKGAVAFLSLMLGIILGVVLLGAIDCLSDAPEEAYLLIKDFGNQKIARVYLPGETDFVFVSEPDSPEKMIRIKDYIAQVKKSQGKAKANLEKAKILESLDWYDEKR